MRFAKYVAVQVIAYAIDMGTFILLTKVADIDPILANVCAKVMAGACAFFAHRHVTFHTIDKATPGGQALRYFILLGANIPLSAGLLKVLMYVIGPPVLAKFIADVANVLVTYWASKALVFRGRADGRTG